MTGLSLAIPGRAAQAPDTPRELVQAYLHDEMNLTPEEIESVNAGQAVAKTLPTTDGQDVSLAGAVRIGAPAVALIQQLKNIDSFEGRMGTLQIARFHEPARLEDLGALTLEPSEVQGLSRCEPRACDLQLPADAMARFRTTIDWQAPDAATRANRLFQLMLFDLLAAYRTGGHEALGVYEDRGAPTHVAAEFQRLIGAHALPVAMPELTRYLSDYPRAKLRGADDVFYWSKAAFGMKPTVRLSHMTIYPLLEPRPRKDGLRYLVATKQVYSSHYFSTTLELRSLVDDYARPGKGFFLFYTTKSRVGGLAGFVGAVIRTTVKNRARAALQQYLDFTKRAIEKS